MNEQIKTPKGIKIIAKIIAGLMFILSLMIVLYYFPGVFLFPGIEASEDYRGWALAIWALCLVKVFFVVPLLFIAGIGLWKTKEWGLFFALIAFGAKISTETVLVSMDIGLGSSADADTYFNVVGTNYEPFLSIGILVCIVIFAIISILYLWRKRKCFL